MQRTVAPPAPQKYKKMKTSKLKQVKRFLCRIFVCPIIGHGYPANHKCPRCGVGVGFPDLSDRPWMIPPKTVSSVIPESPEA